LEAPLPENATADVLLSLPQYFSSVQAHFATSVSANLTSTTPHFVLRLAYIASRLPILKASPAPNGDTPQTIENKG
jgi:hypothetical protein